MSATRKPKAKLCRRFGEDLFGSEKYAKILSKKNYPPGMHGQSFSRNVSEFGKQLLMKQKMKLIYGVREKQFRKHYEDVKNKKGVIGDLLLARLERRLDNTVYRLGFATTRPQARQIVNHGMFYVNGKKMNIPSYEVQVGDTISVNPHKKENGYIAQCKEFLQNKKNVPSWLTLSAKDLSGKVVALPKRDDVEHNVDPQGVIEYYSK